jgi:hypothetical protein
MSIYQESNKSAGFTFRALASFSIVSILTAGGGSKIFY